MSDSPVPPRSFSPLSPSSFSFLKNTLHSPTAFSYPHVLTPCKLDSPLATPEGGFYLPSRGWAMAAAESSCEQQQEQHQPLDLNNNDAFDAGNWVNDLHAVLLLQQQQQHTSVLMPQPQATRHLPHLSSYISDGESPDNSPVSSDVEDGSPKPSPNPSNERKRRVKRAFSEIAQSIYAIPKSAAASSSVSSEIIAPLFELDSPSVVSLAASASCCREDCDDIAVLPKPGDEADEYVRAALIEDSKEYKIKSFPRLMVTAKAFLKKHGHSDDMETAAANALLSAFTNNDKTGRPLPKACQELLRMATEEVAQARKRQRESKTSRRSSLMQGHANEEFVCKATGCNKRYTTAEGLRLHIRNHHDVDKKWMCHSAECTAERAFVRQADLRMHLIRMHSPIRPFPCRVPNCPKTFACHSELRRHIPTEHPELVKSILDEMKQERR